MAWNGYRLASAVRNWMWAVSGRAHPWGEANPEGDETWRQLPSSSTAGTKTPSLKKIQGCISKSSISSDSVDRSILHSLWPALHRGELSSGVSPRAPAFPPEPPPRNRSTRYWILAGQKGATWELESVLFPVGLGDSQRSRLPATANLNHFVLGNQETTAEEIHL